MFQRPEFLYRYVGLLNESSETTVSISADIGGKKTGKKKRERDLAWSACYVFSKRQNTPTGRTRNRRQLSNSRNLVFPKGYTTVLSCSAHRFSHLKARKVIPGLKVSCVLGKRHLRSEVLDCRTQHSRLYSCVANDFCCVLQVILQLAVSPILSSCAFF